MKRMQLIAAALCLIMLTTVGAGVVAAKQEANPHQAGKSSVYFYEVKATDTPGSGKLMINLDQHKFIFNGKGFDPSQQYYLRYAVAGTQGVRTFASVVAAPSGNIHAEGTWTADLTALPEAPAFTITALKAILTADPGDKDSTTYGVPGQWFYLKAYASTGDIARYQVKVYKDYSGAIAMGTLYDGADKYLGKDAQGYPYFVEDNRDYKLTIVLTVYDSAGTYNKTQLIWPMLKASFTATFDHIYQNAATWGIDASSSKGPIVYYQTNYYYVDASGKEVRGEFNAPTPDNAIQLHNINYGTPVTANLTVRDASGNTATSPDQLLPWS